MWLELCVRKCMYIIYLSQNREEEILLKYFKYQSKVTDFFVKIFADFSELFFVVTKLVNFALERISH